MPPGRDGVRAAGGRRRAKSEAATNWTSAGRGARICNCQDLQLTGWGHVLITLPSALLAPPLLGDSGASCFAVLAVSVTNVIGNDQVFGYRYSFDGLRRDAITSPAKRFFFIGLFMSFGTNRSKEVIENNN